MPTAPEWDLLSLNKAACRGSRHVAQVAANLAMSPSSQQRCMSAHERGCRVGSRRYATPAPHGGVCRRGCVIAAPLEEAIAASCAQPRRARQIGRGVLQADDQLGIEETCDGVVADLP